MPWSYVVNGKTYTDSNVKGRNYARDDIGIPALIGDLIIHVMNAWKGASTTSLVVSVGAKILNVTAATAFSIGQPLRIARTSDPANVFMDGEITAILGTQITVQVNSTKGSGTFSDWTVFIGGYAKVSPSTSPVAVSEGGTGASTVAGAQTALDILPKSGNLAGLSNVSQARTALGLGSIAVQNSPLPVSAGGSGSNTAAGARSAYGLGSAATQNVGTAAGNVVQLDGSGRLPAIDISQGTGFPAAPSSPIPSGSKMVFLQATAPSGWVQDTTLNDRVLRVVSNNSGGQSGGSWTVTGLTITGWTWEHVLTLNQIPPHSHTIPIASTGGTGSSPGRYDGGAGMPVATGSAGGGDSHGHQMDQTVWSDSQWRPAFVNVIACTKS